MLKGLRGNLFAGLLGLLMLLPLGLTLTGWTTLRGAVTAEGAALTDYAENILAQRGHHLAIHQPGMLHSSQVLHLLHAAATAITA